MSNEIISFWAGVFTGIFIIATCNIVGMLIERLERRAVSRTEQRYTPEGEGE